MQKYKIHGGKNMNCIENKCCEKTKEYQGYPNQLADILSTSDVCKDFLQTQDYKYWIKLYSDWMGHHTLIGRVCKKYILISLAYILNELKKMGKFEMLCYINDTHSMLTNVISISEKIKGWNLDIHMALGLCSKIISDYMSDRIKVGFGHGEVNPNDNIIIIEQESESSALEQIIDAYSDDVLKCIQDPVWDWFYIELKDIQENEMNDEEICEKYDIDKMKEAVRERRLLPDFYDRMVI